MRHEVFLDASYAIALSSPSDEHHIRAAELAGQIEAEDTRLDTTAPDTVIDSGPKKRTAKRAATFTFSSSEPNSSFKCKLDKQSWKACSSPHKLKKLSRGKHQFHVRATDAAGNVDQSPATRRLKIVRR